MPELYLNSKDGTLYSFWVGGLEWIVMPYGYPVTSGHPARSLSSSWSRSIGIWMDRIHFSLISVAGTWQATVQGNWDAKVSPGNGPPADSMQKLRNPQGPTRKSGLPWHAAAGRSLKNRRRIRPLFVWSFYILTTSGSLGTFCSCFGWFLVFFTIKNCLKTDNY